LAQKISNSFFDKEFEIKEKIRLKKIEQELREKQEKYEKEEMEKLKEKDKHIEKSIESIPQNENGDLKKELNETDSDNKSPKKKSLLKKPKQKSLLKKLGMEEEYNNLNKNMEIINKKKIKKAKDSNQSKEVKLETVKTPKKKIKNAKDNKTIFSYGFINKDHQKIYSPNCTKKEDSDAKTKEDSDAKTTYSCILESNN